MRLVLVTFTKHMKSIDEKSCTDPGGIQFIDELVGRIDGAVVKRQLNYPFVGGLGG